jgi:MFS family permease
MRRWVQWPLAPNDLMAARAGLDSAAAMIIPATLAIIRQIFDADRERSIAVGVWSGVAAGGAALGPMTGGLVLEHFWRLDMRLPEDAMISFMRSITTRRSGRSLLTVPHRSRHVKSQLCPK